MCVYYDNTRPVIRNHFRSTPNYVTILTKHRRLYVDEHFLRFVLTLETVNLCRNRVVIMMKKAFLGNEGCVEMDDVIIQKKLVSVYRQETE